MKTLEKYQKGSRYPRAGYWCRPKKGSKRKCVGCGETPAGRLHVQVSWFRGDDLVIAVCRKCKTVDVETLIEKHRGGSS